MALRIPTKTSDRLTVISYLDDAIDFDHPDVTEAIRAYIEADTPDYRDLPMLEGGEPTLFTVRPLSEREMAIASDMARTYHTPEDGEVDIIQNNSEANYQILRLGLAEVTGLEGWLGKKERIYSSQAWTMESVEDIDRHTAEFLALTIRRWSSLQKKTSLPSGLSPEGGNGTRPTNGDRSPSTATSAKSTKDTQECTAATKKGKAARAK